jgi:hypothetical protein
VHERLVWPLDKPGAWHVNRDATEEYFRQLVAEARVRSPVGKPIWIERSRANHYLDAEAMAAAAGFMLNVHALKVGEKRIEAAPEHTVAAAAAAIASVRAGGAMVKPGRFGDIAARLNR